MSGVALPGHPRWHAGSNGARRRHWFVWRKVDDQPQEQLVDRRGRVRWFASFEAAQRAADKANA